MGRDLGDGLVADSTGHLTVQEAENRQIGDDDGRAYAGSAERTTTLLGAARAR